MNSSSIKILGIIALVLGMVLLFCNGGGIIALIIFGIIGISLLSTVSVKRDDELEQYLHNKYGNVNGDKLYNNESFKNYVQKKK